MRKLNELEVGTKKELNVLVTGLEERMTKNNRPYVVFQVTDGETVADVRKWDATVAEYESYENTVVNMDIRTSVYNNNRSYDTDMILPTPLPASDFVRKVPEDIAMMMSSIMERVKQISSRNFVRCCLLSLLITNSRSCIGQRRNPCTTTCMEALFITCTVWGKMQISSVTFTLC